MRAVIGAATCFLVLTLGGKILAAGGTVAPVRTVPLKVATLAEALTGYGTVETTPRHSRTLSLPYAARVTRLLVAAGEVVAGGAPLAEVSVSPADALAFAKASSDVEFASAELERVQEMANRQFATRSQLDQARQKLADARRAMELQQRLGTGMRTQTVTAPFAGVVTTVAAAPGDLIQAGATLLQIARRDGLQAVIGIEPEELGRVRPGMPVRVVSVFNPSLAVTGKVAKVFGMVNPKTRLVDVAVTLGASRLDGIVPGTRVRGTFTLGRRKGYAVPRSAVLADAAGSHIFVVRQGRASRVAVKTGLESDGKVAITGAVRPGEPVVVQGNYELQDGMTVREEAR